MAEHVATVTWERRGARFTDNQYSRAHRWLFDGGASVAASASPHVLPPPLSEPRNVDPEEAFVAAIASCHMLWFLSLAANRGITVDRYRDEAVGYLEKSEEGRLAITRVLLRPRVEFSGSIIPSAAQVEEIHHDAHDQCFIANSVRTAIEIRPSHGAA